MSYRNTDPEFVGLDELINQQAKQLHLFEEWARIGNWGTFHKAHYDWWMFPIDQPSRLGYAYTIHESELNALKSNEVFMVNYRKGIELLLLSWGWDMEKENFISKPETDQHWQNWPIRLYKCVQSAKLFGLHKEYYSARKFGKELIQQGEDFTFRGKDLSDFFINGKENM